MTTGSVLHYFRYERERERERESILKNNRSNFLIIYFLNKKNLKKKYFNRKHELEPMKK